MVGEGTLAGVGTNVFAIGLRLIEDDATLTFITFLGMSMLGALGVRFSYYANQNIRKTKIESQHQIWQYLQYIGVVGAAYAAAWIVEIVSSGSLVAKNGLWLAMTLLLVFSLRQISTTAGRGLVESGQILDRALRLGFVGLIVLYVVLSFVLGLGRVTAFVEGVSGAIFLVYGVYFFRRQVSSTRLQGTMLDSLVRHLLPVLTFSALVSVVSLAVTLGADRTLVLHVQLVFLIMTATALMTATIKLRQNIASL